MEYSTLFDRCNPCKLTQFQFFRNIIIGVLLLLALGACDKTPTPFNIKQMDISPDPVVGQTVTLLLELHSIKDEPEATIDITLPPEIQLVSGSSEWRGSLTADEPYIHTLSVCVSREGQWIIRARASSWGKDERRIEGDSAHLYIESDHDSGEIISPQQYKFPISESTPLPESTTPICPEPEETK